MFYDATPLIKTIFRSIDDFFKSKNAIFLIFSNSHFFKISNKFRDCFTLAHFQFAVANLEAKNYYIIF